MNFHLVIKFEPPVHPAQSRMLHELCMNCILDCEKGKRYGEGGTAESNNRAVRNKLLQHVH